MSLVVQDDNGVVSGANSYITLAQFKSYHDARGNDYSTFSDSLIEQAIIKATDYLDIRFKYVGVKRNGRNQTTQWPRNNAWDADRYYVNEVPLEVKDATAEYGFRALTAVLNPDPDRDTSGQTVTAKSQKVGPIEESVRFANFSSFAMPKYPAADQMLLKSGLVQNSYEVFRG